MTGLETAELLGSQGNDVTVLEMLPTVGNGIFNFNVTKTVWALEKYGVTVGTQTRLDSINADSVTVFDTSVGQKTEISCDAVVLAIGVYMDHSLRDELEAKFAKVVEVGDVNKAGKIMTAVRDGYDRVKIL